MTSVKSAPDQRFESYVYRNLKICRTEAMRHINNISIKGSERYNYDNMTNLEFQTMIMTEL